MINKFKKYQKINESSYPVEKCQGNNWTDDDALPFLIEYDGKVRLGDFGDTHSGRFGGHSVHSYGEGYAGRMWIREKLMAFWTHPPQDRMEEYMNNLVEALNNSPKHKNAIDEFVRWRNFDIWDFKIDTRDENYDGDGRPPSLDEVLDTDFTRLIDILIEDSEFDFGDFFSDEEILERLRDNGLDEKVLRSLNFEDFVDTLSDQVYSDNLKKFLKSDVEFSSADTEYDKYRKLLDGKSRDELIEITDKLIGIDNFINRFFKYHNKKEIILKAFQLQDDNDFLVNYIEKKFLRSDIERYISRTVSDSTLDDILERFKEEEYFDDEYELISLKDYARLEETPEDPPEEAYLQHLQSPLLKSKNVKDRFPGYKHKRLAWQLPGELEVQARARMYQEKLTTKFRLFENPHYITLPDGKQQFTNLKIDICFGYYKGRFYSEIGTTHPRLVPELYDEALLGSTINIREEIEYSGRLFMEQKIVTFWDFPETKEKFREIIKKLEQNHDLNIWDDKEWRVEVIRNSEMPEFWWDYSKEVEYIPLDEYKDGFLKWDKKTLQIQHVLSPLLKTKQKSWGHKKLQGQLPGELDVAARARMFQEKNDNKMLTKFNRFKLFESNNDALKPAYLMTLSEYTEKITPVLKEFTKWIKKNLQYYIIWNYSFFDYISWEEFKEKELESFRKNNYSLGVDYIKKMWRDRNGVEPEENIPDVISKKFKEYTDFINLVFDKRRTDADEVKSNKKAVRRAFEDNTYLDMLRDEKLTVEELTKICDSVGVKVPIGVLKKANVKPIAKKRGKNN